MATNEKTEKAEKSEAKSELKPEAKSEAKSEVKLAAVPAAAPAAAPRARDVQRDKAIDIAVSTIEKQFGKGSIMRLGEDAVAPEVLVVPTGSLGLDIALGMGGLPRGRIVEVYGPESSGKTTLALHAVAQSQLRGGICAFVDAEHALDVGYARKLGVRTDDLLVSQPDCGEQALEITEMLVRSCAVDVIVVDSVAALTPRAELEGEMGDSHVGLQARLMSQALRKLTGTIAKSNTLVVFINQIRMKIGVMFGNPETTTGGNALKFYSSVRLDIRRVGALKDGDKVVGNRTRVKVVKNKLAAPFKEVEFDILYGEGISREGDLIDLGAECGAVEKSGAWFGFEGERIGQGRENAKQFLRDHPDMARRLELKVLAHHGVKRDAEGGAGGGAGGGATVHALSPQPKPASEKSRR
ncbi:MAG TPA: recombinase RecA [Polyangia bacterium]|nr:recombinase RecA [Polyangia bacterium]